MYLVFRIEFLRAIFHDGAAGDNTNECVFIVYHRNEVLGAGPCHQIMHIGGDPDGDVVSSASDFHDPSGFSLAHIQVAHIFQCPQKVTFGKSSPVFAVFI